MRNAEATHRWRIDSPAACPLPFDWMGTLSPSASGIEDAQTDWASCEFCRAPHSFLLNLARTQGPNARFRLNSESLASPR